MSWLGDVFDFEGYNLGQAWDKIKQNPERLFIGALDPFSSGVWGKVLGKDYEPLMNQTGGPTDETLAKAEERGINTGPGKSMHTIAQLIASWYGGAGAAKGMGNAGLLGNGASGASSAGGAGTGGNGAFLGEGTTSGVPAWDSAANPGMMDRMRSGLNTFNSYAKPVGQAYSSAKQVGLLGGDQQPSQMPGIAPQVTTGNETLAALAQQPSANIQQMQAAEQMRQKRRMGLLGGGYGAS